ncbi:hypothetical protein V8E36_001140 [Tilletia maclaganii]
MPSSMIRIRHPNGAATVKIEPGTTVNDLRALIQSASGIEASHQDVKMGYPPKSVDVASLSSTSLVTEPPLALKAGAQLIVSKSEGVVRGTANAANTTSSASATTAAPATPGSQVSSCIGQSTSSSSTSAQPAKGQPPSSLPAPTKFTPNAAKAPVAQIQQSVSASSSAAQPRLTRKRVQVADGEVYAQVDGGFGFLVLRVTEDDNSCLFHAVSFAQTQEMGEEPAFKLRQKVAQAIVQHEEYSDVILGHPREEYVHRILSPQTWGGAIEIAILSKVFSVQINAIDVRTGVVHRFGEGDGYAHCCYLVYSGIHYDVLALLPFPDAPTEYSTTLFETESKPIEEAAERLVAELRARKYFTDTASFALTCGQCGKKLFGEKAASAHASQTGHTDFRELDD